MKVWQRIANSVETDGLCALVTLANVEGSAPREAGARMVIERDGNFHGTIGGGTLEWRALAEAQKLLDRAVPVANWSHHLLGPDLGQCCGGAVRVLTEVFDTSCLDEIGRLCGEDVLACEASPDGPRLRRTPLQDRRTCPPVPIVMTPEGGLIEVLNEEYRPVWIFGSGHVGKALASSLGALPFDVSLIDPRNDALPNAVPENVRLVCHEHPANLLDEATDETFILVVTHSHSLDMEIVEAALRQNKFDYVGLIGSATKRARFTSRLKRAGLDAGIVDQMVCPIGLPGIGSKLPQAIAASVTAQLLERDELVKTSTIPLPRAATCG